LNDSGVINPRGNAHFVAVSGFNAQIPQVIRHQAMTHIAETMPHAIL
jgi:hypothetical protein